MQRYFFHTQADTRHTDEEGLELKDAAAARREAIRTCGEMMRDAPESFWNSRPRSVVVTNSADTVWGNLHGWNSHSGGT